MGLKIYVNKSLQIFFIFVVLQKVQSRKLEIKKLEGCEKDRNYPIKYNASIENRNGIQYISSDIGLPETLDETTRILGTAYTLQKGKRTKIFSLNMNLCDITTKIMGRIVNEMKAAAHMPEGCVVPKGTYHLVKYPADFNKLKVVQTLPSGQLAASADMVDRNKKLLYCLYVEFAIE